MRRECEGGVRWLGVGADGEKETRGYDSLVKPGSKHVNPVVPWPGPFLPLPLARTMSAPSSGPAYACPFLWPGQFIR